MLNLFNKSYLNNYMYLLLLTAALVVPHFLQIDPIKCDEQTPPLLSVWYYTLGSIPWASTILATVLLLLSGLVLNETLRKFQLTAHHSITGSAFYLFLMLSNPHVLIPEGILMSNFLLILTIYNILLLRHQQLSKLQLLNMGLFIGSAVLFEPSFLPYVLFIPLVLIRHSLFSWRGWLIPIIGLLGVGLYLYSYLFIQGLIIPFHLQVVAWWNSIHMLPVLSFHWKYVPAGLLILFLIWSFFLPDNSTTERYITIRSNIMIINQGFLIGLASWLIKPDWATLGSHIAVFGSAILAQRYSGQKVSRIANALFILFLLSIILLAYVPLIAIIPIFAP